MFANWCKETTTTTGTGTLTLSSVSGFPRFANAFATNEMVSYAILNSTGEPIEAGIGKVGASNTLARTLVKWTYSGGTLTTANASAVSLSAGAYTVIATAIAGSFMGAAPALNTSATQRLICSPHNSPSNGSDSKGLGTSNVCFYVPFYLMFGCDVDALVCNVSTGAAGNLRLGLYNVASSGTPGDKIVETADIDSTATGLKTGTFTRRYLAPGWYFTAVASKGVASSVSSYAAGSVSNIVLPTPLGMSTLYEAYNWATETLAGGWTALPTSAAAAGSLGYGGITADFAPRVALRAA